MKNKKLYIVIEDRQNRVFATNGPIALHTVNNWLEVGNAAKASNPDIWVTDLFEDYLISAIGEFRQQGYKEVQAEDLIDLPADTGEHYMGDLPKYAQNADRAKLVKVLCKGQCKAVVWAEMQEDFPGKGTFRGTQLGDYRATCLKCGKEALDCYNWTR